MLAAAKEDKEGEEQGAGVGAGAVAGTVAEASRRADAFQAESLAGAPWV